MLDMSWGEVMLIGGVALIVIGPKDLPKALRTVGQVTTRLRRMAGEFQMQFNEAIREAELDEVRKEVDGLRNTVRSGSGFNPVQTIRDELKGAVEGRTSAGRAEPAADLPASDQPAKPAFGSETYGPEKPAEAPRSLADATAQLKAEQGAAASGPAEPETYAVQAAEAPLPIPGSVEDPFGTPTAQEPSEPAAADIPAKNGAAGR